MAFFQYLNFDGVDLPLPDSYEVDMADKEADSGGETEAGTVQRDVVRTGVVTISVSFSVTQKWLRLLTRYKQQEKIRVGFFDPETASVRQTEMYVEGFKAKLKKDTSYKGLWIVNFTLKELSHKLGSMSDGVQNLTRQALQASLTHCLLPQQDCQSRFL